MLLATALIGNARLKPMPDAAVEAQCRQYFKHAICSEALGRWLPRQPGGEYTQQRTPTTIFDGFRGTGGVTARSFGASTPVATSFVHGSAGPPRGTVTYDRQHRIAFYGEGCCTYFDTILASGVSPPPLAVANRNLKGVGTDSGIRLGDVPARVMRVYGNAPLGRISMHPEMRLLAYENALPRKHGPCIQRETFAFKAGRLVFISLYNGC